MNIEIGSRRYVNLNVFLYTCDIFVKRLYISTNLSYSDNLCMENITYKRLASTALSPRSNTKNKFSPLLNLGGTYNVHTNRIEFNGPDAKQKYHIFMFTLSQILFPLENQPHQCCLKSLAFLIKIQS